MPWHFATDALRLAEDLAAPQDDVRADELFDQIEDQRLSRVLEPGRRSFGAVPAAGRDMRTDQTLGRHIGAIAEQTLERGSHANEHIIGKANRRANEPV